MSLTAKRRANIPRNSDVVTEKKATFVKSRVVKKAEKDVKRSLENHTGEMLTYAFPYAFSQIEEDGSVSIVNPNVSIKTEKHPETGQDIVKELIIRDIKKDVASKDPDSLKTADAFIDDMQGLMTHLKKKGFSLKLAGSKVTSSSQEIKGDEKAEITMDLADCRLSPMELANEMSELARSRVETVMDVLYKGDKSKSKLDKKSEKQEVGEGLKFKGERSRGSQVVLSRVWDELKKEGTKYLSYKEAPANIRENFSKKISDLRSDSTSTGFFKTIGLMMFAYVDASLNMRSLRYSANGRIYYPHQNLKSGGGLSLRFSMYIEFVRSLFGMGLSFPKLVLNAVREGVEGLSPDLGRKQASIETLEEVTKEEELETQVPKYEPFEVMSRRFDLESLSDSAQAIYNESKDYMSKEEKDFYKELINAKNTGKLFDKNVINVDFVSAEEKGMIEQIYLSTGRYINFEDMSKILSNSYDFSGLKGADTSLSQGDHYQEHVLRNMLYFAVCKAAAQNSDLDISKRVEILNGVAERARIEYQEPSITETGMSLDDGHNIDQIPYPVNEYPIDISAEDIYHQHENYDQLQSNDMLSFEEQAEELPVTPASNIPEVAPPVIPSAPPPPPLPTSAPAIPPIPLAPPPPPIGNPNYSDIARSSTSNPNFVKRLVITETGKNIPNGKNVASNELLIQKNLYLQAIDNLIMQGAPNKDVLLQLRDFINQANSSNIQEVMENANIMVGLNRGLMPSEIVDYGFRFKHNPVQVENNFALKNGSNHNIRVSDDQIKSMKSVLFMQILISQFIYQNLSAGKLEGVYINGLINRIEGEHNNLADNLVRDNINNPNMPLSVSNVSTQANDQLQHNKMGGKYGENNAIDQNPIPTNPQSYPYPSIGFSDNNMQSLQSAANGLVEAGAVLPQSNNKDDYGVSPTQNNLVNAGKELSEAIDEIEDQRSDLTDFERAILKSRQDILNKNKGNQGIAI